MYGNALFTTILNVLYAEPYAKLVYTTTAYRYVALNDNGEILLE